MKRVIAIFFFVLVGALSYADALWTGAPTEAQAQARRPTRVDYSKFKHSTHAGAVKAAIKGGTQRLDCAYCHGSPTQENPDVLRSYPYKKYAAKSAAKHSACNDCHLIGGREALDSGLCLICHQNNNFAQMAKNVRPVFPNPKAVESQFYDRYSHKDHTDFFGSSDKFAERFKDKKKFKQDDHFECVACHDFNKAKTVVASIEFAPGVKENLPGHLECFACHFDEKELASEKERAKDKEAARKKPSFATNCVGCHAAEPKKAGTGSELAVHWFVRQIVNNEKNPPKPGSKPLKPFSHKTHENFEEIGGSKMDVGTKTCLECHATGKRADKRSDFFLEDKKSKEKQPRAGSCVECHKAEMQQKIEGAVKLESAKCTYCHALPTIKERAAAGVALPPPSHFFKKAAPTPTPTPKPEAKPEAKPAPPASNPEPAKSEPKPETKPATTVVVTPPTPPPSPPKSEPPKSEPPKPSSSPASPQPLPTTLLLGDPKKLKWAFERGPVEFDHTTHIKPTYAERCEVCHHTNKDARQETVQKCTDCHLLKGLPNNAKNKAGDEVDTEIAYHGSPDNQSNNAGCIECHKRFRDKHPESKAPIKAPCSGCHLDKQSSLQPGKRRQPAIGHPSWSSEWWGPIIQGYKQRQAAAGR